MAEAARSQDSSPTAPTPRFDQIPVGSASSVRSMGMASSAGSKAKVGAVSTARNVGNVGNVGNIGNAGNAGNVGAVGNVETVGAMGSVVPLQPIYVPPGGYVPVACCPSQEGVMLYPEAVPMGYSVPVQAMKRMGSSSVESGGGD